MRSSFRKRQEGAVVVEFAFVAPILFLILFGLIEGGRLFFTRSILQYAVGEAGRYAMVNTTASTETVTTFARQNIVGIIPANVTVTISSSVVSSITYKQITLSYTYSTVLGHILPWNGLSVSATTNVPIMS